MIKWNVDKMKLTIIVVAPTSSASEQFKAVTSKVRGVLCALKKL